MFALCSALQSVTIKDVTRFDFINMDFAFYECPNLTDIDITG